ncbi:MAG: manganese efflux pump [Cyanobacteria bacterium SIG26]|nr:manganese efflux pump [Cyanobacteria bacterium SIG26]
MNLIDIVLLAIALGIDCLVVSFSQGLIFNCCKLKNSLSLAFIMGLFQGVMPVIGYMGINSLYEYLVPYSKWIVFAIFFILGSKFIYEAFQPKEEEVCCIGIKCLIGLGIATSIDALVSGISLKLTNTSLLLSCIVIGLVSFIMSFVGFWSGNYIKNIRPKFLEVAGGVILLLLAIKAVVL